MKEFRVTALLLGGIGSGLTGCSLAPAYHTPGASVAAASFQEAGDWKPAQPADTASRGPWWEQFHDAGLNALELQADSANQSVKAAYARLQQARAGTRVARAGLIPKLSLNSFANRTRTSQDSPRFPATAAPISNNFDLEADLSYEIDLFGRVRNTLQIAKATQQASEADVATLKLSLEAELALDYLALQSDDAQAVLLDRAVENYGKALELTTNLYRGGAIAVGDVAQARAQLESARTLQADNQLQRATQEHAIAVLVGANPTGFHLAPDPLKADATPPVIDAGLPSALLERRPDVAAAERRVAAANAQIGIARAAYFPVFSLAAAGGYNSVSTASWFNAPSRLWSIGASGALALFDAGSRGALSDASRAAYDEQVANYRGTVLTAFEQVEDSLAALRQLQLESASEAAAVTATQSALQQAQFRYAGGAASYLEVTSAQNAALQAQLAAATIQVRRFGAAVLLVKALGGGWTAQ